MCAEPIQSCEIAAIFEESSVDRLDEGNFELAEKLCRNALRLCEHCHKTPECILPKLFQLEMIHLSRGEYDKAAEVLRHASQIIDYNKKTMI